MRSSEQTLRRPGLCGRLPYVEPYRAAQRSERPRVHLILSYVPPARARELSLRVGRRLALCLGGSCSWLVFTIMVVPF